MVPMEHFWSNPKCKQNAHCFLLLFLYLKFFENLDTKSLALIQFNTKNINFNLQPSLISVETNYVQFLTFKNTYSSKKKKLKFMFTEAELMLKVYVP